MKYKAIGVCSWQICSSQAPYSQIRSLAVNLMAQTCLKTDSRDQFHRLVCKFDQKKHAEIEKEDINNLWLRW